MSTHAIFRVPEPYNEPVRCYAPGSPEREELQRRLRELESQQLDIPLVIGGEEVRTGDTFEAVDAAPPLARARDRAQGRHAEVERAIAAAGDAWHDWSRTPWEERAAVFLRAAELLAGPWRSTLNAATMLGQSKTAHQAEIDAACELIDFWRFNVKYMTRIYEEQPLVLGRRLEPARVPAARGLRLRGDAVQLHRDRREPADVRRADGQHRRLEARVDGGVLGVLPDEALRGGRHAAGRDQPRLRLRRRGRRSGAREPRPRRHPLHRLDRRLQRHVEQRRGEPRALPQLPAHRRRDGRQGLHRRARLRRRRLARDGDRARLVRVPGPEVLGGVAASSRRRTSGRSCASGSSRRSARCGWATSPTSRTSWAP